MTLTAKDVAEITRLLEESSFDELILEHDGLKLTLRRNGVAAAGASSRLEASSELSSQPKSQEAVSSEGPAPGAPPPASYAPASTSVPVASPAPPAPTRDVIAPLLGTFYRAPKPGSPPFVEVGATVEEETIIGIIEVMKLMNTVRAGTRGRVMEILARDGALVEYGQTLMRVDGAPVA